MSPVTELLQQYSEGQLELDELAAQFAQMQWPRAEKASEEEALIGADPEPDPLGSFAEVEQAFVEGALSANEYRTLMFAIQGDRQATPGVAQLAADEEAEQAPSGKEAAETPQDAEQREPKKTFPPK